MNSKKQDRLVVARGSRVVVREKGEDGQKIETTSYKGSSSGVITTVNNNE